MSPERFEEPRGKLALNFNWLLVASYSCPTKETSGKHPFVKAKDFLLEFFDWERLIRISSRSLSASSTFACKVADHGNTGEN